MVEYQFGESTSAKNAAKFLSTFRSALETKMRVVREGEAVRENSQNGKPLTLTEEGEVSREGSFFEKVN